MFTLLCNKVQTQDKAMAAFTTKLKLGGRAFGVTSGIDPYITNLTVGQIRVTETLPALKSVDEDVCYKEEYMCIETGVGSGTIWTYGKNIFATELDAQAGVVKVQQAAYKERAARDAWREKEADRKRAEDLRTLERLKRQYG